MRGGLCKGGGWLAVGCLLIGGWWVKGGLLLLAGQYLVQEPPHCLSVHPCCVMRLLDSGLRQRPLERQVSPCLQHHVPAPASAEHGCWFVSTSPHVL